MKMETKKMNMKRHAAFLLALVMLFFIPGAALAAYSMPVADDDLSINEDLDDTWRNILLIGTDTRERKSMAGRSDTMMICSLNEETGEVKIISLARDTWVEMGDKGHMNKLNAAHSFGGPNLLMQTINRVYDLNISEYVAVNFYGVADIVDAMGGVQVQLDKGEASVINNTVNAEYGNTKTEPIPKEASEATLNGAQALAYARIRKLDNDFGRQSRQRKIISGMIEKAKACSPLELIGLLKTGLQYVSTNLEMTDILSLTMTMMDKGLDNISMISIPSKGHYHYENNDGTSKVIVDPEQCAQEIHAFIYE